MELLCFYYSTKNAGRSPILSHSAHNYREPNMATLLSTPAIDNRYQAGKIHSRIGLEADAVPFDNQLNLFTYTETQKNQLPNLQCVLIDEAQFLTKAQVEQLTA